jgi:hypothetical protein
MDADVSIATPPSCRTRNIGAKYHFEVHWLLLLVVVPIRKICPIRVPLLYAADKINPLRSWRLCYTELAQMVILSYKMVYIHQEFTHDQST